jgi:STE24 endopeptidase
LRKLTEKNLSNLTPHPVFSAFYYSHPTLLEREAALQRGTGTETAQGATSRMQFSPPNGLGRR